MMNYQIVINVDKTIIVKYISGKIKKYKIVPNKILSKKSLEFEDLKDGIVWVLSNFFDLEEIE